MLPTLVMIAQANLLLLDKNVKTSITLRKVPVAVHIDPVCRSVEKFSLPFDGS